MDAGKVKEQMLLDWFVGLQRHIVETPEFHPLLQSAFPFAPEAYTDLPEARRIFHDIIQHVWIRPDEPLRRSIIDAIISYQKAVLRFGAPAEIFGKPDEDALSHFQETGWARLPSLPEEIWQPIRDAILDNPVYLHKDAMFERPVSLQQARDGFNIAKISTPMLLGIPEVRDLLYRRDLLALVAAYLGCVPFLLLPTAWWSFKDREGPKDAQFFHSDLDDLQFCKIFIYLTDVDEESGPHTYVEATHSNDLMAKTAAAYPGGAEAYMNWYRKELRKSDEEVLEHVGRPPVRITGEAGTMFIADTRGLHKGQLPFSNDRLVCQFTYGVSPRRAAVQVEALHPPETSMPMRERKIYRYVNRMFLA